MPDTIIVTPSSPIVVAVNTAANPATPPAEVAVYEGQPGPQGIQGVAGPTGATGAQGPAGPTPTIAYTHTQNAVSSTWSITHNLGFYPNVSTVDVTDFGIEGAVAYNTLNSLTVTFGIATTGKAYLS
jgi:hypothetical protein